MTREPYLAVTLWRIWLSARVRQDDAMALLEKYAPTAIAPWAW